MSAKVMELKNKLIKQLEWSLNKHDDLLDRALSWGNWQMEC